ncbi:hypothetical protein BC936DRAFT_148101 [Jimgerdemannia flammicorona]|uniref:Uncharacterized protein n=1 Tax=Jimgerdemannia flammicorona TaxID=994334 RepID=A0A433DKM6_9FUNG|nr:hypothetical protein BC936DRAFT_148101 [Jimgerdemannia flammicorona]
MARQPGDVNLAGVIDRKGAHPHRYGNMGNMEGVCMCVLAYQSQKAKLACGGEWRPNLHVVENGGQTCMWWRMVAKPVCGGEWRPN